MSDGRRKCRRNWDKITQYTLDQDIPSSSKSAALPGRISLNPKHVIRQICLRPDLAYTEESQSLRYDALHANPAARKCENMAPIQLGSPFIFQLFS